MVTDIVKQAVQIKMTCAHECPLISEAEYAYACYRALLELNALEAYREVFDQAKRVEELREKMTPYFREKRENCEEGTPLHRLLSLLIHSRVEGEITDEVRTLMQG
jgi:hypothetical protein